MKANELRIGNLIYNQVQKINIIVDGSLISIEHLREKGMPNHEGFESIPLTEEWLFELGLTKEKDRSCEINYTNKSKRFKLVMFNGKYGLKNSRYFNIQYVHQLQNLYFALTGEELTIK